MCTDHLVGLYSRISFGLSFKEFPGCNTHISLHVCMPHPYVKSYLCVHITVPACPNLSSKVSLLFYLSSSLLRGNVEDEGSTCRCLSRREWPWRVWGQHSSNPHMWTVSARARCGIFIHFCLEMYFLLLPTCVRLRGLFHCWVISRYNHKEYLLLNKNIQIYFLKKPVVQWATELWRPCFRQEYSYSH